MRSRRSVRPRALAPLLLLLAPLVLAGCMEGNLPFGSTCTPEGNGVGDGVPVCFETPDGWLLQGTLWEANGARAPTVLLVHGIAETQGSYAALGRELEAEGFNVLAFDLRGHGLSRLATGEVIAWPEMDTNDWVAAQDDLVGASEFLNDRDLGAPAYVVGASLGANLVLRYAASDDGTSVAAIVLLSPGLNYRGVVTSEAAQQFRGKALLMASEDDNDGKVVRDAEALARAMPASDKEVKKWPSKGHGTRMLDEDGRAYVAGWLTEAYGGPGGA